MITRTARAQAARKGLLTLATLGLAGTTPGQAQVTRPFAGVTLVDHPGRSAMAVVDLCAAGVSVRATRYDERRATPQVWAQRLDLELAVNADFFEFPGWGYVVGRARGDNQDWPATAQRRESRPYVQFGPNFAAGVANGNQAPAPGVRDIVGGHNVIIQNGKTTGPWLPANDGALLNGTYRRTAIGFSADERTLYIMAVNATVNAQTVVDWLIAHAAEAGAPPIDWATNMDGGGSSQLYVKGRGQIITSGREVGNHLGISANGTGAPGNCTPRAAAPDAGGRDAAALDIAARDARVGGVTDAAIERAAERSITAADAGEQSPGIDRGQGRDAGTAANPAQPIPDPTEPDAGDEAHPEAPGCSCRIASPRADSPQAAALLALALITARRRQRRRA